MKTILRVLFLVLISANSIAQMDSSKFYYEKALDKFNNRSVKGVLDYLDKSIEFDSTFADAYIIRARVLLIISDKYPKALNDVNKAILLGINSAEVYSLRGSIIESIETGNYYYRPEILKKALNDYNLALQIDSTYSAAYCSRAFIWEKFYNQEGYSEDSANYKAIADLTKAIYYEPEEATYYYNRAIFLNDIGDKIGACEDAKKAYSLGLESADFLSKFCE